MKIIETEVKEAVTNPLFGFKREMGAILLGASIILFASCSRQPSYPSPPMSGQDCVFDVSSLQQEVPRFYTYQYQGKSINFFVLKLQDRVLSFLDACTSCYPHKQGYRFNDGFVTCRFCTTNFSIFKLEKGIGGCYPIKIDGRMKNGKYLIPVALLAKEAGKF